MCVYNYSHTLFSNSCIHFGINNFVKNKQTNKKFKPVGAIATKSGSSNPHAMTN